MSFHESFTVASPFIVVMISGDMMDIFLKGDFVDGTRKENWDCLILFLSEAVSKVSSSIYYTHFRLKSSGKQE